MPLQHRKAPLPRPLVDAGLLPLHRHVRPVPPADADAGGLPRHGDQGAARRALAGAANVHTIVFLFSVKTNKTVVYKSLQEPLLDHLLYSKTDLTGEQIVVMLRKFDYQDEETTTLIVRMLLNAITLVALFDIGDITTLTSLFRL